MGYRELNLLRTGVDEDGMGSRPLTDGDTCSVTGDDPFDQTLAAARAGDGDAFELLFVSMSRRVRSFVALRGAGDPDGVVNDVFLKVFTNLNGFVGNEIQFRAWVYKIARNTLIDEVRRSERRIDETTLDAAHEIVIESGDVEVEAIDRLGDDWVLAQLDVLTPEQREVVVLRVVSDLTIEAIAEVLGKRVDAVKAMQRRAFRTLAKNLDHQAVPQ
jgi:RNA polymerase sigma factor (sigma-70 family)